MRFTVTKNRHGLFLCTTSSGEVTRVVGVLGAVVVVMGLLALTIAAETLANLDRVVPHTFLPESIAANSCSEYILLPFIWSPDS